MGQGAVQVRGRCDGPLYLAEHYLFPCTEPGEERFSMTLTHDLVVTELVLDRNPVRTDRFGGCTTEHLSTED